MDLREYMMTNNLQMDYFLKELDIGRTHFCAILAKRANPSNKLIRKIKALTNEQVTEADFFNKNVFGRCDHCGQLIRNYYKKGKVHES